MTMETRILSFLKRRKNGASKKELSEGLQCFGAEWGEYIRRLRRKGYDIPCIMREGVNAEGKAIRFGVYVLRGKK